MMATFLPWWRDRSLREQWLVGVMAMLLVVVIAWLGIIRPLAQARATAATRHAAAVMALGDVHAMAGAIRRAEGRRSNSSVPLIELVSGRATEAGLTTERMDTGDAGQVTTRIAAIKPSALLRWIANLETRDGVVVDRLNMTRNDDETIAADLTLRRGV